jgi:hypothetical protein
VHASTLYKCNAIASTISASIDWHKDKGVEYTALACKDTKDLNKTIKAEQGPHGIPNGKQGMTKEMMHLLLRHFRTQRSRDPHMEALYLRDTGWLLQGFFGMLWQSKIIALQMQDILVGQQQGTVFDELLMRRSKNDRRGEGATVTVAGVSKDGLKTARLLQEWVTLRQQH